MKQHLQIVEVEWEDSGLTEGWDNEESHMQNQKPLMCRSVGWLASKTRTLVVLVGSRTCNGQASNWVQIPRNCIRSMRVVEK